MKAEATADLTTLLAQAGWLRRFARALVGDTAAAEDLAQETMLTALGRPATGRGRAWLATVARNLAVNRFRGNARRMRREEAAQEHSVASVSVHSPEDLIGSAQIHRQVAEAVAGLAEPFRQTVVLRFYEGLSSAEIARRLGKPEGTIRWRLKEALDRVRADLDRRYGEDRSAWRAALAPLVPVRRTDTPPATRSRTGPYRDTATVTSPVVAMMAAGVLAVAITAVGVARWRGAHGRRGAALPIPSASPPPHEATALPPSSPVREGLPDTTSALPGHVSTPPTPGRSDAQVLAEELLAAIETNDYDAFVAKGSPIFRLAAGRERLDAANAKLGGRLERGYHISTLGSVHRRQNVDWIFKLEFDDGGDDALCTLAMDGWQVAGFFVTDGVPQLTENHHE